MDTSFRGFRVQVSALLLAAALPLGCVNQPSESDEPAATSQVTEALTDCTVTPAKGAPGSLVTLGFTGTCPMQSGPKEWTYQDGSTPEPTGTGTSVAIPSGTSAAFLLCCGDGSGCCTTNTFTVMHQ
jgi:hypothetical protein